LLNYQKDEKKFEIILGSFDNPKVVDYHEKLQTFSLFFIQGSSFIESEDEKWKIFFLFENSNIVGYCTVYPFYGYPDRTRLRISQFIILPPFQKQGHGSKLLNSIYNYAKQINSIDVCVEDASEEFQMLRDKVDLKNFQKLNLKLNLFDKEFKIQVKNELKLNDSQIRKCYEIEKLNQILSGKDNTIEKKKYELEVKRRLFKEFDLNNIFEEKEECKSNLDAIYQEVYQEYIEILK
jgi:histone acetyltransferase 1